jgi:hypothetical protein
MTPYLACHKGLVDKPRVTLPIKGLEVKSALDDLPTLAAAAMASLGMSPSSPSSVALATLSGIRVWIFRAPVKGVGSLFCLKRFDRSIAVECLERLEPTSLVDAKTWPGRKWRLRLLELMLFGPSMFREFSKHGSYRSGFYTPNVWNVLNGAQRLNPSIGLRLGFWSGRA